ncbi:MAG: indole-3-glycerol phosphate synthase TrpC [Anaerolineae bacterium]|jgi:indole-3-glycerol phosphate synthase
MTILDEIFAHKRVEVAQRRKATPLAGIQAAASAAPPALGFLSALHRGRRHIAGNKGYIPALIPEIKHASPSRGVLIEDFDPLRLAGIYRSNGAAAVSVLTDWRFFQGGLEHLSQVRASYPDLPLLRKDFICDPYQVYEGRACGADAILLIVAGLGRGQLAELHALTLALGMTPLVEVHNLEELERALAIEPMLVGVNNRDLRDFTVNLETSLDLRMYIPESICMVAESGIHNRKDVERLAAAGVEAMLIGEALVQAADVGAKVRELLC